MINFIRIRIEWDRQASKMMKLEEPDLMIPLLIDPLIVNEKHWNFYATIRKVAVWTVSGNTHNPAFSSLLKIDDKITFLSPLYLLIISSITNIVFDREIKSKQYRISLRQRKQKIS